MKCYEKEDPNNRISVSLKPIVMETIRDQLKSTVSVLN